MRAAHIASYARFNYGLFHVMIAIPLPMIAQLTGTVIDIAPGYIVLDVHGVGYLVFVSGKSVYAMGENLSVYTHLAVRENVLDLYGFTTRDELSVFEALIKIPKIGPKTALQILSQADLAILSQAVSSNDASYLSKMSGIGKKSAEKIVVGLRDVLGEDGFAASGPQTHARDADVVDALVALGYPQRDAASAVQQLPNEITGTTARITEALKYLAG
jgi:holliday junction DNA helicase RuvA